jgi:prolipoprotein diacylglyceryl transferase
MPLAYLPSPPRGVWWLGPVPLRAYALCILAGVVVAVLVTRRRWIRRGGRADDVVDIAGWVIPFGLLGGRLYHVVTSPQAYFGAGGDPVAALYVWRGGLGIWGAVALGSVGAWIACRRRGIPLPAFADAVAPGLAVAQGLGRWGNWFNQELFGRPTTLSWGLEIAPGRPNTVAGVEAYHPTFLYESLWVLAAAGVAVLAERRFRLTGGRVFALYVMLYTTGRAWIEALRIDEANQLFGLRLNEWTSLLVFLAALTYFVVVTRRQPQRDSDAGDHMDEATDAGRSATGPDDATVEA